jgi:hypothetical protein
VKAVVNGGRRTIDSRTILPTAADTQHVDNAADDAPIIDPAGTGPVLWQQRLNRSPLPIAQPEFASHDPNSNLFRRESWKSNHINILIEF